MYNDGLSSIHSLERMCIGVNRSRGISLWRRGEVVAEESAGFQFIKERLMQ